MTGLAFTRDERVGWAATTTDGHVITTQAQLFNHLLTRGGDFTGWEEAWEYPPRLLLALLSPVGGNIVQLVMEWDGTGWPPDGWVRYRSRLGALRRPEDRPGIEYWTGSTSLYCLWCDKGLLVHVGDDGELCAAWCLDHCANPTRCPSCGSTGWSRP